MVTAAAALGAIGEPASPRDPWEAGDSWRLNLPGVRTLNLEPGGTISATPEGRFWRLAWGGTTVLARLEPGRVVVDGVARAVTVVVAPRIVVVIEDGTNHVFARIDPLAAAQTASLGSGRILAPIPGRVAAVLVAVGETVSAGQTLAVMEAMKMEIALTAPAAGKVASLHAVTGDMVTEGHELVVLA
jgi:3-methylcrotonyl-CoA carboxylase alpha subunit